MLKGKTKPLIAMMLVSVGCCFAAAQHRIVQDQLGRKVKLSGQIRRVISLTPSSTENLFAIGAGHLIVGVCSACDYPQQVKELPQVGDFMKPSLERIVALKPDLIVIISATIPKAIADDLQGKTKTPVFVLRPQTVGDVLQGLVMLSKIVNREGKAQKLVRDLERRLRAVMRAVKGKPRPKVVVEVAPPPSLMVIGSRNYIDDAIRYAGGENAFADAPHPFPMISLEVLAAKNPDIYVVAVSGQRLKEGGKRIIDEVRKRPGYSDLRCVKTERVYGIDADQIFRPTPRLMDGIERLAKLLHP